MTQATPNDGMLLYELMGRLKLSPCEMAVRMDVSEMLVSDVETNDCSPYELSEFNDAMAAAWGFDLNLYRMAFHHRVGNAPEAVRPAIEGLQRTTRTIVERLIQEIKNS